MHCHQALCGECGAAGARNTCPLILCFKCRTVHAAFDRTVLSGDTQLDEERILLQQALLAGIIAVEQNRFRNRTYERHQSSLRGYAEFIRSSGNRAWPPSQEILNQFALYLILLKGRAPATVSLAFGAISGYIQQLQAVAPYARPQPWYIPNHAKSTASNALLKTLVKDYKLKEDSKSLLEVEPFMDVIYNGFNGDRFGLHNLLFTVLSAFVPARPDAVANLRLVYTVVDNKVITDPSSSVQIHYEGNHNWDGPHLYFFIKVEKNVASGKPRHAYVPATVCGFPIFECLVNYILTQAPISGNYLLSAPAAKEGNKWRNNTYSNFNEAFQKAVARALKDDINPKDFGGGTPRKSFAQMLNVAGYSDELKAAIGGWSLPDKAPMRKYMVITPRMQMQAKADLPGPSYK